MREISFAEAIAEATIQTMEENKNILLFGEGVDDPKGAFGTTLPVFKKFGGARVFDSPLSESALTGVAVGAALEGVPCIYVHLRTEFALLGIDQIINHAAKWRYMSGGALNVPIVIRCIIGRGWGQAAQHSQSFHGLFAQIPGIKVVLPSCAYDAKGLLVAAIRDPNPVIVVEHRWLHDKRGLVPEEMYEVPLGKANVVLPGDHVTCVAISHAVLDALQAREELLKVGISMEVIDPRTVRPLDMTTILESIQRTGRLIVADVSPAGGISSEIAARATEEGWDSLERPVIRIGPPDVPTPCSWVLENAFYPGPAGIVAAAKKLSGKQKRGPKKSPAASMNKPENFVGPF